MNAKGKTPADARLLLATVEDKNYETQVEVNTGNGNTAGLILSLIHISEPTRPY